MKTKTFAIVFLIINLISCSPAAAAPRSDNFAFVFQDYSCSPTPVDVLDTTSGTLVHTPLGDTASVTISLRLTDDELEAIYQKATAIGFFDYPAKFVVPDDQVRERYQPSSSYQLSITNGALTNSVKWTDDAITKPGYTKADLLQELINLIQQTIQVHPEFQQLPKPKSFCL